MSETKNDFVVKAEVPRLDPKDIDISVASELLTIKGEKKQEKEEKNENHCCCESNYGAFSRSIRLPCEVQSQKIMPSYKNGILKIILPKSEKAKRKEIKIEVE